MHETIKHAQNLTSLKGENLDRILMGQLHRLVDISTRLAALRKVNLYFTHPFFAQVEQIHDLKNKL